MTRPYIFHGSIGPAVAVALWEGDEATVWTQSQGVFQLRRAISMALGLDEKSIRAIHGPGAGCYGHNGCRRCGVRCSAHGARRAGTAGQGRLVALG